MIDMLIASLIIGVYALFFYRSYYVIDWRYTQGGIVRIEFVGNFRFNVSTDTFKYNLVYWTNELFNWWVKEI